MQLLAEWIRRFWYFLNRRRFDAALRVEMDAHRAMLDDPGRFGNSLRLREEARDVWGWLWLDRLGRDLRFAVRSLRRAPSFTMSGISSLTLAFAFAAAAIAVVKAYSLAAFPYAHTDRLYHVRYAPPGPWEPSHLASLDWLALNDVIEHPIGARAETFYLSSSTRSRGVRGLRAMRGFADGLGVSAVAGRPLQQRDFAEDGGGVALIGHGLWLEQYAADPEIVGRSIRLESETTGAPESYEIVGVLPPGFYFGRDSTEPVDVLVPSRAPVRTYMVRLRDGVPPGAAEERLSAAVRRVAPDLPADWSGVQLTSVHERYLGPLRPVLRGVVAASAIVMLLACANLAVLVVLRLLRRERELALRVALGSSVRDLVRSLLFETVLLCTAGAGLGLLLSVFTLQWLAPEIEAQLGRPAPGGTDTIRIADPTVLFVIAMVGVVVALALSLLPAMLPRLRRVGDSLRGTSSTTTDGKTIRSLRWSLVAWQIAGTTVLLATCVITLTSVSVMARTDFGYDAESLVRSRIVLRAARYPDSAAFSRFYAQFAERLATATGSQVAFANWPPFFELPERRVEPEGAPAAAVNAGTMAVGGGYFATLGIALRAGRDFTLADTRSREPVVVISESLAAQFWPGVNALGRSVRVTEETGEGLRPMAWATVIGVAADVRQTHGDQNRGDVYRPLREPGRFGLLYVRTASPVPQLWEAMREIAAGLDPYASVDEPRIVSAQDRQLAGTRFLAALLTFFAGLATLLALIGMYGVTAYAAQQRQRELAIRMAIGATGDALVRLLLKDAAGIVAAGLIVGSVGTIAASRVLAANLHGVSAFDLPTLALTLTLLAMAAFLTTWWPVRRATLQNPGRLLTEG